MILIKNKTKAGTKDKPDGFWTRKRVHKVYAAGTEWKKTKNQRIKETKNKGIGLVL